MCGIVGYIGKKEASPILLRGIKTLEYRGYDSCGLAVIKKNQKYVLEIKKGKGKIDEVDSKLHFAKMSGNIGLAHTRWATHGEPSQKNAHPQSDCQGKIAVVHNGIIENYQELKEMLKKEGHRFKSDTDTEVIAHLIEKYYFKNFQFPISNFQINSKSQIPNVCVVPRSTSAWFRVPLEKAVLQTLKELRGAYAIAVISSLEPNKIIVAKLSSPMVLGLGKDEYIVASDPSAIINYTRKVIYLDDRELAVINSKDFKILNFASAPTHKKVDILEWDKEKISKKGYAHFMLKEIMEQPESILNSIRGRYILNEGKAKLGGLEAVQDRLRDVQKIIIVACGTARLASLTGEYMLEEYAGIPVEVDYAHEFRYRKPLIDKKTALMAISQSGETADTLAAVREAKEKGALVLGIVNVVGSTVARETEAGVYNHSGPEIAVASTKAFTSQLAILALLTVLFGRQRNMSLIMGQRIIKELLSLPAKIKEVLTGSASIKKIVQRYSKANNFLLLGRKYNHPIALEGAIKIKELSYIHAEGLASGEMKHGPIAMIEENFPSIFVAPEDSVYEKNLSGMQEIKARKGKVIAITTQGNKEVKKIADEVIYIPKTLEMLTPILSVIPLQLFAYHLAVEKGLDVDKPRNLAKSVTVE